MLKAKIHPAARVNPLSDNRKTSATTRASRISYLSIPDSKKISHGFVADTAVQRSTQKNDANVQKFMPRMEQEESIPSQQQQSQSLLPHQTHVHPHLVKQTMHNLGMQLWKHQQLLWQNVQSVVRPPKTQPSMNQQASFLHQQSDANHKQSNLQIQKIHQLMEKQGRMPNMSWVQPQMPEQHESVSDFKQQQQQNLPIQQEILLAKQKLQVSPSQQTLHLFQQHQLVSQNNMQDLKQQMLQLPGLLPEVSNMSPDQQSMHLLQQSQSIAPSQELLLQSSTMFLQQLQQSRHQSSQLIGSEIPFQLGQLQQPLTLHQEPNYKQKHMEQSLQPSDFMLQIQSSIEKQKQFIQSHGSGSGEPSSCCT